MRERLLRGAGLAGAGFVSSRAITLGAYIVIASLIAPRAVGQYAAGTVVVGMALLFAESGMLGAIIHWRGDVDEAASTATVSTALTGVLLTLLGVATAPLVGTFFDSRRVGEIAAVSSGFLLLRSLAIVPEALLQRRFSFVRRIIIDPLGSLAFAVAAIVAAAGGMGPWSLVVGTYALYVVEVLSGWTFVRWRPRRHQVSFATWRELAGFGRHVVASEVVRRVTTQLDTLVLGRVAGAGPLGQYTYGLRLASQPAFAFVGIAAYILLPAFARLAEDPQRLRRGFIESFASMQLVILPMSLLLLPIGDQLTRLAFGPEWGGAGEALKALCLLGVGLSWTSIASEVLKAVGRPAVLTRIHLVTFAVSVVLIPASVAVPWWPDPVGVGLAVTAASLASGACALHHSAVATATTLGHLLVRLDRAVVACAMALVVTGAADVLAFGGGTGRGAAAVAVVVESALFAATYLFALRAFAPRDFGRLGGVVSGVRGRRVAVGA